MLGAPCRLSAVGDDLAFQDALDAFWNGCFGLPAALLIDKGIGRLFPGYIAKQVKHTDHRAVVERDVLRIASGIRVALRPAAIVVLGFEHIIQPLEKGVFEAFDSGGLIDLGQVSHLRASGAVVKRGIILSPCLAQLSLVLFAQDRCHVDIFLPAA